MHGAGTLINTAAVIGGGLAGHLVGRLFAQEQQEAINKACGVSVLFIAIAGTMEGMLQQVASYHNGGLSGEPTDSYALGYTLYSYLENVNKITGIGEDLKILAFEGVVPTRQSIADGIYPLSDGYYAVVRKDLPEDHSARSVIRWLESSEGAKMIESCGFISCAQ